MNEAEKITFDITHKCFYVVVAATNCEAAAVLRYAMASHLAL